MRDSFLLIDVLDDCLGILSDVSRINNNFVNFRHFKKERLKPKPILRINFDLGLLVWHGKAKIIFIQLCLTGED